MEIQKQSLYVQNAYVLEKLQELNYYLDNIYFIT